VSYLAFLASAIAMGGLIAGDRPPAPVPNGSRPERRLSAADVVRLAEFGIPDRLDWTANTEVPALLSPDGKSALVIIRRGDPSARAQVGTLLLIRLTDRGDRPTIKEIATLVSRTNDQPIALPKWMADNDTFYFAGKSGDRTAIFRGSASAGNSAMVESAESEHLFWYDVSTNGEWLATISSKDNSVGAKDTPCDVDGCLITGTTFTIGRSPAVAPRSVTIRHLVPGGMGRSVKWGIDAPGIGPCYAELSGGVSPDGAFGIRECKIEDPPLWWAKYDRIDPKIGQRVMQRSTSYIHELFLTDFSTSNTVPLTGTPRLWAGYSKPIWIDGGRNLILAGAFEAPKPEGGIAEVAFTNAGILLVNPRSGQASRIATIDADWGAISEAKWIDSNQLLLVSFHRQDGDTTRCWHRAGNEWTTSRCPADAPLMRFRVLQSLNQRPLFQFSFQGGPFRTLIDPNKWLDDFDIGIVKPVSWTLPNGLKWTGHIYYPPNYQPGTRYPLVMLTGGVSSNSFSLVGPGRNFEARPLAARGLMVLDVDVEVFDRSGREVWPLLRQGFESAIDNLDSLGLIDPRRVGIQGWSGTGPAVGYFLTHSDRPIAAAALTETADYGWWFYLQYGASYGGSLDAVYGSAPFGSGKKAWLEDAPTFNLDRVGAPVLMWEAGNSGGLWDWYAGLKRLNLPVEYWEVPDGVHDLVNVEQRIKMGGLLVDWYDYWLNGTGDVSVENRRRWTVMLHQRDRAGQRPRPPLLEWSSKAAQ